MANTENNFDYDNQVTFRDFIFKVKGFYRECLRNWKLILLIAIPFVLFQLYQRFMVPKYYPAKLIFMVNEAKGSSISNLLGQFSGLIGGGEGDNMDKILELSKIRRIIGTTLLRRVVIDGKEDLLGNHLIRIQNIHKRWKKIPELKDFYLSATHIDSLSINENRALVELHKVLVGSEKKNGLLQTNRNKKTGLMYFKIRTKNEQLSIELLKQNYKSLSDFYVESTIRKEKESFTVLSAKKDSIEQLLKRNDLAAAQHDDRSNSLLLNVDKVPSKRFSRNNQVLSTLYAEVVKNTELAEFALKTATPYITVIDEPSSPLEPEEQGSIRLIILFFILGVFVGALFVILRKIYRDAMA